MSANLKTPQTVVLPNLSGIKDPAVAQVLNDLEKVIKTIAQNTYLDLTALSTTAYVDSIYFGAPKTNGSWRIIVSGSDLLIQRLISGAWTTKSTITG